MDFKHIRIELKTMPVVYLYLKKPSVHNAFDEVMIHELLLALAYIQKLPDCRVLVLAAEGVSFCAGADLQWMQRMAQYNLDENLADANQLAELLHQLATFPCPTIAMVQGSAYGGGVGLVAACDLAIASDRAKFCLSEVKWGLIPAVISPYLINTIGPRATKRYSLTAETLTATQAATLGLVDNVVTSDELPHAIQQLAQNLLQNGPEALAHIKKLILDIQGQPQNAILRHTTVEAIAKIRISSEGQAGLNAFLNKQTPPWIPTT